MATRTQKAAAKAKANALAETGKAAKAKPKKPAAKPARSKGKRARSKSRVEFEEIPSVPKVGFFERLRQKRAERAVARQEEAQRQAIQRAAQEQHDRELEAKRLELAAAAAREQAEMEAAEQRKAAAAAKRAQKKAEKEAEELEAARLEAERRQAEVDEAARKEAEKEAAAEEQRAKRAAERNAKRAELEAEERRLAAKQAERDSEEEAERRRQAVQEAQRKEAAQKKPLELEPEMEFQDAPKPVDPAKAMVATEKPGVAGAADVQADRVAAELAKRRSKPVVIVEDEPPAPRIPGFGSRSKGEEAPAAQPLALVEEAPARPTPAAQESMGMALPEAFLLLANEGGWDERAEKNKPGFYGAALAGSMLLELLLQRQIQVQRDRFVNLREETDDPAVAAILARVVEIGDRPSLDAASAVAKRNRELLLPFKQRLAERGLVEHGSRKHLGLFHRSWVNVLDNEAQERLRNRLRRAIAGGGTPEAASILLLGLLDAAGLLGSIVPDEAMDYNRKRLNGLLGGRDIMGYKVDPELKALQEIAVRTILQNVRLMTVRG